MIVASTAKGQILVHECGSPKQAAYANNCLYQADGAAIWDISVWRDHEEDVARPRGRIFAAEDSGRVVSINTETLECTQIYVSSSFLSHNFL